MTITEIYLIALLIIFAVPWLVWRVFRTEYWAPLVVVLGRRVAFMRYALEASPPIFLPRRPSDAELDQTATSVAASVESFVRAHPTDWFDFG